MSSFADYAPYYDLFYRGKDYAAEATFVLDVLGSHGCHPRNILELGCGTGGHAEHFAKSGCSVLGVDLSERMVERAAERFAALPVELSGRFRGMQGDASSFVSPEKVDAVVSLFHVASYQTTNEALGGYFASASSALNPGGIFFFDFWYGPAVLSDPPQVKERREKADDGTEIVRHTRPTLRENDNIVEVDFRFLLQGEGTEAEFGEIHPMRYLFLPEIFMFSQAVGLRLEQASQWMTLAPLGRTTWYGCAVLRKISGVTNP
jgi:SAM-dependent methyltransferase